MGSMNARRGFVPLKTRSSILLGYWLRQSRVDAGIWSRRTTGNRASVSEAAVTVLTVAIRIYADSFAEGNLRRFILHAWIFQGATWKMRAFKERYLPMWSLGQLNIQNSGWLFEEKAQIFQMPISRVRTFQGQIWQGWDWITPGYTIQTCMMQISQRHILMESIRIRRKPKKPMPAMGLWPKKEGAVGLEKQMRQAAQRMLQETARPTPAQICLKRLLQGRC